MKYTYKLFLILLFSLSLYSCVTQKRCMEKFPPSIDTTIKDSISIEKEYIDTIVYIPGDSIIIRDTIYCDEDNNVVYIPQTRPSESGRANADISFDNGILNINFKCDSLEYEIEKYKELTRHYKETQKTITKHHIQEKEVIPWWIWIVIGVLISLCIKFKLRL